MERASDREALRSRNAEDDARADDRGAEGGRKADMAVTEPPNYNGSRVPVIVIMTSDSRTYVPHNLKGMLSSE
jgi:hypothetical protein